MRMRCKITKIINKGFGIFKRLVVLGVALVILVTSINIYMKKTVDDKILSLDEAAMVDAECIIVLGAGVFNNDRPSLMLEDRLKQGINLYNIGASDRIIMSGDHGRVVYDEVNVMKQYAIDREVPSSHVFMDHAGFSTYESMYRARDIFEADKMIIVTQEYHMYRALYIANQLGIDAYGVPAEKIPYYGQLKRDTREVLARVKDYIKVISKAEPTYLGEAIPVSGNGDLTNDK